MKRIAFFLTSLLVLSFGLANAQGASIVVSNVNGDWPMDATKLNCDAGTVTFELTISNNTGGAIAGVTSGFRSYSPDGASHALGAPMGEWTNAQNWATDIWNGGIFVNPFVGTSSDTVGFGAFKITSPGYADGMSDHAWNIFYPISCADSGLTFCLDSSFYRPGGSWLWSGASGGVVPDWGGPYCYMIDKIPNLPPEIDNCPGALAGDHCVQMGFGFTATDTEGDPITFELVSGPGSIDANSGMWSYSPSLADVGAGLSISVRACDNFGVDHCGANCDVNLTFSNAAPSFTGGCGSTTPVGMGNPVNVAMSAAANDCDPFTFSIVNVSPAPVGSYSIDPNTGLITFNTVAPADGGNLYTFTVEVSDGNASSQCDVYVDVLVTEPFEIQIEKTHMSYQGAHETVDIVKNKGSEALGGFDFLIAYDASALTFVGAMEGSIYAKCGWEYFTYRYGANGNCSGGCPSGLLRVVGIAETNNGPNHPSCYVMDAGDTFATLDFLVSDDRTLECQYVPVRFFWLDCGDNTLSSQTGDSLFISRFVYDFDLIGDISNPASGYPTYTGAQDADCFTGDPNKVPIRFVDFINGGVDIACADSIDARGDINLNEIANEIADAVLFSNYFIHGIGVFTKNVQGQIAASDVNADGLTLSVADLVYLIRVIVGDALPYAKVSPVAASWSNSHGVINVNSTMGAAYVVVEGNVVPQLLADNMEMKYNYDGSNTRILVYSTEANETFAGDFLNVNGNVVSIEMATYEGAPVAAKEIPNAFALKQNYPNPFNPSTAISFDLEKASDYELTIYNVTGQVVTQFAGHADAGTKTIEWDASNMASGVYFYKLNAGNFSDTKKMVLLK